MGVYSTNLTGFPTSHAFYEDIVCTSTNWDKLTKYMVSTNNGVFLSRKQGAYGGNAFLVTDNYKPSPNPVENDFGDYTAHNVNIRDKTLVGELGMFGVGAYGANVGYGLAFEISWSNSGEWSSGGPITYTNVSILKCATNQQKGTSILNFHSDIGISDEVIWNQHNGIATADVARTHFGYITDTGMVSTICGLVIPSYNKDGSLKGVNYSDRESGSGFLSNRNHNDTVSLVIARLIPTDRSNAQSITGTSWCEEGLVIFSPITNNVMANLVDGSATKSAIKLTQAISPNAMTANVGMTAVEVMATSSGATYHLGCKHGIYKIYNGRNPYITKPGNLVSFGKKIFRSIAYGCYYARLA